MLFVVLLAYAGLAFAAVNINSATQEQLESLDGVGPVKAQAIIDYRKKNGSFKSLEDVKKVYGIGDATFEKIKKNISLTGTTVPVKADKSEKVEKKVEAAKDKAAVKEKAADTKAVAKKAEGKVEKKADAAKDKAKEKADKAEKKVNDKKAALDKKEADEKKKKEDEKKKKGDEKKK